MTAQRRAASRWRSRIVMQLISTQLREDFFLFSFGAEEAVILLRPGAMIRAILDRNSAQAAGARFLTRADTGMADGMLAILPRSAAPALLSAVAGHAVERELQERVYGALEPVERPPLQAELFV